MADYLSIIWPEDSYRLAWEERVGQEFSGSIKRDLNAERIVNAVFARTKKDKDKLERLFYYPLRDADPISFRLEVMQDIRTIPELFDILTEFSKAIPEIRETYAKSLENRNPEQDAARVLEAACMYINAANFFYSSTKELPIKSRALIRMRKHFEDVVNSEEFKKMSDKALKLQADLHDASSFYMALNSNPSGLGILRGTFDEAESIPGKLIKDADILFRNVQKPNCSIYNSVPTTAMEQKLIECFKEQMPEVFERLEKFRSKYENYPFTEEGITEYEFEFYLAYIAFVRQLEEKGFQFCVPRVSENGEERVFGVYDLGLAHDVVFERGGNANNVVGNDFQITPDERVLIITGPNQGGKTTFARSVGLFQVLAQAGCLVAAREASFIIMDKMLSQFPERENVGGNKGRLSEEIIRIAEMLKGVTSDTFIIFNESFASARRADGAELGRQLIKILLGIGCKVLFVTHLYELSPQLSADPAYKGVAGFMAEALETEDGSGRRTYKIIRKTSDGLVFAMDIAKRTGVTYPQIRRLLQERKIIAANKEANN